MSNSPLVSYTRLSPNCTKPRNAKIDTITIHCVVGQLVAKDIVNLHRFVTYDAKNGASCNYAIGKDGSIALGVNECDRSWCSSSRSNDHRAITIEVASDMKHPYAITSKAYDALIELCADICKRNDIKELKWKGDKNLIGQVDKQNMTVHRWFAPKSCPGEYIYSRLGKIANEVNAKLGNSTELPFRVKVSIDNLVIRCGPGTNFAKTGNYTGKGVFTIMAVKPGKGSTAGWGKLKSGAGWISLDFATKL